MHTHKHTSHKHIYHTAPSHTHIYTHVIDVCVCAWDMCMMCVCVMCVCAHKVTNAYTCMDMWIYNSLIHSSIVGENCFQTLRLYELYKTEKIHGQIFGYIIIYYYRTKEEEINCKKKRKVHYKGYTIVSGIEITS